MGPGRIKTLSPTSLTVPVPHCTSVAFSFPHEQVALPYRARTGGTTLGGSLCWFLGSVSNMFLLVPPVEQPAIPSVTSRRRASPSVLSSLTSLLVSLGSEGSSFRVSPGFAHCVLFPGPSLGFVTSSLAPVLPELSLDHCIFLCRLFRRASSIFFPGFIVCVCTQVHGYVMFLQGCMSRCVWARVCACTLCEEPQDCHQVPSVVAPHGVY